MKKSKKNLRVANFKLNELQEEKAITNLSDKLQSFWIQEDQCLTPIVFPMELNLLVENLVESKRQAVFQALTSTVRGYLKPELDRILTTFGDDDATFQQLIALWTNFQRKLVHIKNVYIRYDRSTKRDFKFNTSQAACMDMFKCIIILHPTVWDKITEKLLVEIARERSGFEIDVDAIECVLDILQKLGVYKDMFETKFFEESIDYFRTECEHVSKNNMDITTYFQYVNRRIKKEQRRWYVKKESLEVVLSILYKEMIETNINQVLEEGFSDLMSNESYEYLKLTYQFSQKIKNGMNMLAEHFKKYALNSTNRIVGSATDKRMIQEIIDLKDKLDKISTVCFEKAAVFFEITKKALDKTLNKKNYQSAMYLAKYLDSKLRTKNVNEMSQLEATIEKILVIFRLIQGKDVFEAFYRKDLTKRLIFSRTTNQDVEHNIVAKLKNECGEEFTYKIEGMLKDINLNNIMNKNFKEFLHAQNKIVDKSDVSMLVLTSGFWAKSTKNGQLILPNELLHYQATFSEYYISIYNGRKLEWQSNWAHCVLKMTSKNDVKELLVSLYQTLILVLFNEYDILTGNEIYEQIKLDTTDLLATLHSLACNKIRVLKKSPDNDIMALTDTFEINEDFQDKHYRIKINQVQLKDTDDELKRTEKSVLLDRHFRIDAAIVRILKTKRTIEHTELVAELYKALNVPVGLQDVKKRIEILIERDFIKRDVENSAKYTYIA